MNIIETLKLFDSELKIMDIIWEKEPISAKEISKIAGANIGWNKNTTYTIIKKLIDKNVVKRVEPNFMCSSIIKKTDVQKAETYNLIDKLYNGSRKAFFSAFLEGEQLNEDEISHLRDLIDKR